MEINSTTPSTLETDAVLECLKNGIRADLRTLDESRPLIIHPIVYSGIALVSIGGTTVSVRASGEVFVPRPETPGNGKVTLQIGGVASISTAKLFALQRSIRSAFRGTGVFDESTLCIEPGKKAWHIKVDVFIHDADGGIYDAAFAGIYAAITTLRFPHYNQLKDEFSPNQQQRAFRASLSSVPVVVSLAYYEDKIIVDPTAIESKVCDRYSLFMFNEESTQLYYEAKLPGDYLTSRRIALDVAKNRLLILREAVDRFDPKNACEGIKESAKNPPAKHNAYKTAYEPIPLWTGTTEGSFSLDMEFQAITSDPTAPAIEDTQQVHWLESVLLN